MVAKKNDTTHTNSNTRIVATKLTGCDAVVRMKACVNDVSARIMNIADRDQHGDVDQQRDAVRPRDGLVVIRQEHNLDVEQQQHRQHGQRQPRHAVQERAHHAAAIGPGNRLHEKEVVELEPQRMGAACPSPRAGGSA